jgi:hypothetical protein
MRSFAAMLLLAVLVAPAFAGNVIDTEPGMNVEQPTGGDPIWTPSRDVLYDNGPLVSHPGGGFGGADLSQVETAIGLTLYGFGWQHTVPNTMADDFVVPAGETWTITGITFFGYQTGSTTASTYTGAYIEIYDDMPNVGNIIFGDQVTNRMVDTIWLGAYRALDTDPMANNRPIMVVECEVSPPLILSEGTYWVAGNATGTLSSGPWTPPVTIPGVAGAFEWNCMQQTSTGWGPGLSGVDQQAWPFIIEGTGGGTTPAEAPTWGQVKALFR